MSDYKKHTPFRYGGKIPKFHDGGLIGAHKHPHITDWETMEHASGG